MTRDPTILSLTVGLLVLSVVFWLLERWRPSLPAQRRQRSDTLTDVAYWYPFKTRGSRLRTQEKPFRP